MNEDHPPIQSSRRAAARRKLAARRQRARAIRRRVAGMSLATFLAATGAVLAQLAAGHDPALAHRTHTTTTVAVASHGAGSSIAAGAGSAATSPSRAATPSAVTTSAS